MSSSLNVNVTSSRTEAATCSAKKSQVTLENCLLVGAVALVILVFVVPIILGPILWGVGASIHSKNLIYIGQSLFAEGLIGVVGVIFAVCKCRN